jgi:hypothetical protein
MAAERVPVSGLPQLGVVGVMPTESGRATQLIDAVAGVVGSVREP